MDEVTFRARTLKTYAEPVDASQLVEGHTYYSLNYYDEEMLIPDFKALVFIGAFPNDQGVELLHFQDFDSYLDGVRFQTASSDDDAVFSRCTEEHAQNIFEFEQALNELMLCSLRRSGAKGV